MLVDTGANVTILNKRIFDSWSPSLKPKLEKVSMSLLTATGESSPFYRKVKIEHENW